MENLMFEILTSHLLAIVLGIFITRIFQIILE